MLGDVLEFPAGGEGYLIGRAYDLAEWEAANEAREYDMLFRGLELRNAYARSKREGDLLKRSHQRRKPDPLAARGADTWVATRARAARTEYEATRHRAKHPLAARRCRHCDEVFMPRHGKRIYCSGACVSARSRARLPS